MRTTRPHLWHRSQRGVALVATLVILLVTLLLAMGAARSALQAEQAARADRDRHIALQAAEAALRDAERDIDSAAAAEPARAALFVPGAAAFAPGCGAGAANPALGLCAHVLPPALPAWQDVPLDGTGTGVQRFVDYGRFTAATMPVGAGMLPARLPRYIIEQLPYVRAGVSASGNAGLFYRITAIGFGADAAHCVVLQTYYLKPALAGDPV